MINSPLPEKISAYIAALPIMYVSIHASYFHMDIPTTLMYVWHAGILSPQGHTHYHHVCMSCMHLISTWTYPLPSCIYGIHVSYLHMDIPTSIIYIYVMHASYLHMDIPNTIMYLWHPCILSPHGHTHYNHVCMACMHLISTWT